MAIGFGLGLVISAPAMASGWTQVYADHYAGANKQVVGMEGGILGAYGFVEQDLEANTTFVKVNRHNEIYKGVSIYTQGQYFGMDGFDEYQGTIGFGYTKLAGNGWSFAPWVGVNLIDNTVGDDTRGLLGWSANVNLGGGQSIYNWTELGLDKLSANGAIGFQQDFGKRFYGALQYRYMYDDAGVDGFGDEAMIRVGYKFK